jgi:hypothetical protein
MREMAKQLGLELLGPNYGEEVTIDVKIGEDHNVTSLTSNNDLLLASQMG